MASGSPSKDQAESFQRKLQAIVQHGASASTDTRRTTVSENEVNSYLAFSAGPLLPVGVTEPSIRIAGEGKLNGRAIADLDAVRRKKSSGSWLDPANYLTGRLPITASGVLHTGDGKARFELTSAEISGIPIPKTLLQEIVAYYSRSADYPSGINLDDVFELPAEIKRIEVGQGQAVIVQ
jgi:hypothetical protein